MPLTPEDQAREHIDTLLTVAGWSVQNYADLDLTAGMGIAVREFPLTAGYGTADYLLYVNRKLIGVIEAKKEGETLTGVEVQSEKYSQGIPAHRPAWSRPLPFLYQSTGTETRFTNLLDPDPRSRSLFHFHQPETLLAWIQGKNGMAGTTDMIAEAGIPYGAPSTLLRRLRQMPPLNTDGMRPAQVQAIRNTEKSLAENRPRALVQMTMGSGKTYTAVAQAYRLIKYAGAKRILFLVDRGNLGRQTLREFQQYTTPDDGRKFTELYNVQHLQSDAIDPVSRVVISTIQRLYSVLKGEPLEEDDDEKSAGELIGLRREPLPVVYNPAIPVEMFDFVIVDECHRSIYNLWRQALEYFDASLIGLTATPSKQTFGYFHQNLVMEYGHAQGVADGVNVDFDVYRIQTRITEQGSRVEAGAWVDKRDRKTRQKRWEELDADLNYASNELDRSVVAPDQIRTIIRTFRDKLFTEIFPGRTEVPKTLIFAKDDSHADDIVQMVREEFGKGNDFCEKITYRTSTARIVDPETGAITYKSTGIKPEDLLSSFRNSYHPRVAVTVDMIATGTDVKPLEIVFFLRDVKSANYFEQMKGRGSRVISEDEFQGVTPDARIKTRFVIVDAVGVCEREHGDTVTLDRKPSVPLKSLLQHIATGGNDSDSVSTLASRLSRLSKNLTPAQHDSLSEAAQGKTLPELISALVNAVDADRIEAKAQEIFGTLEPTEAQCAQIAETLRDDALAPFLKPMLRQRILDIQHDSEQTIDTVSQDEVLFAGASETAKEKAKAVTQSFAEYLQTHRDEIDALQLLYSHPHGKPPTLRQLKALADELKRPPRHWTPETLWHAYEMVDKPKVKGQLRATADLISLIRFALEQATVLAPFAETVNDRFAAWLSAQQAAGATFTLEQTQWLTMIRDQIASSLSMEMDDFDYVPFSRQGGLGKASALFGEELPDLLLELTEALTA